MPLETSTLRMYPRRSVSAWPLPPGSPLAAAVAQADVQHPIRTEQDLAAVVVRERLLGREQHRLAGRVRPVGIAGRHPEQRDHRVPADVGIVHHEPAVGRRRRDRTRGRGAPARRRSTPGRPGQEGRRQQRPVLHDPDGAAFLHDEQPGVAGRAPSDTAESSGPTPPCSRPTGTVPSGGPTGRAVVAAAAGEMRDHQQTES